MVAKFKSDFKSNLTPKLDNSFIATYWWYVSIGLINVLAPNREQAIEQVIEDPALQQMIDTSDKLFDIYIYIYIYIYI